MSTWRTPTRLESRSHEEHRAEDDEREERGGGDGRLAAGQDHAPELRRAGPPPCVWHPARVPKQGQITLRSLGMSVYVPSVLFFIGDGGLIAIVALAARDLGASPALAGLIVALRGVGVLGFDIPAGVGV